MQKRKWANHDRILWTDRNVKLNLLFIKYDTYFRIFEEIEKVFQMEWITWRNHVTISNGQKQFSWEKPKWMCLLIIHINCRSVINFWLSWLHSIAKKGHLKTDHLNQCQSWGSITEVIPGWIESMRQLPCTISIYRDRF